MLLQSIATDKGLDLVVDYDLFLPTQFVGDAGRIRQVLTNLIGNALKFTQDGHVIVRITGIPGDQTEVHIAIEDTGIGIPEDKIGHIFGEFNQVDDEQNRMFEGTGLGLAISKRLVELMGGTVWVDSTFGVGSVFGFTLELDVSDTRTTDLPALPETLHSVILADPKDATHTVLAKQLGSLGLTVHSAYTSAAALDALSEDVGLILLDHELTDATGIPLAQSIRASGCATPLLLLTPNSVLAQADAAAISDCEILKSPVTRRKLFEALANVKAQPLPELRDLEQPFTPQDAPHSGRLMRVLVAEDNKTNQLVLSKMVKAMEIELEFANNGIEAVEAYTRARPDLIFMDISMPLMDGKEATRAIRKLESGTDLQCADCCGHSPRNGRRRRRYSGRRTGRLSHQTFAQTEPDCHH